MPVNIAELKLFSELSEKTKNNPPTPADQLNIAEFRKISDLFLEFTGVAAKIPFRNETIPARDGYQIPIRIYNPDLDASKPIFIMYPGCGFILDLFEVNAIAASRIAQYANIKVIIVNFRLCPEVTMPTPINDAYDATKYISQHSQEFKINPEKIIIGGLSSGAHAASNVASMSRQDKDLNILHQVLLNGSYDLTQSSHEYDDYEIEDKICQRNGVEFIFEQYGISKEKFKEAPFSPLFEKDVSNLPKTTILIGEYDGLRSDSEAYYIHIKSQNEDCERIVLRGQTHNTIIMRKAMSDGEDPAHTIAKIIMAHVT